MKNLREKTELQGSRQIRNDARFLWSNAGPKESAQGGTGSEEGGGKTQVLNKRMENRRGHL